MIDNLQPIDFSQVPGWNDDDHLSAFTAFLQTARSHLNSKPYRQKSLPLDQTAFHQICSDALRVSQTKDLTNSVSKAFFERHFNAYQLQETGFVTGYYEPEVKIRFSKDEIFRYPFYQRPDELVDIVDPDNPPDGIEPGFAFAKKSTDDLSPFPARCRIDQGYLENRGLEIAYAESKADVYFTHIQGSARLIDDNGIIKRITYAAKSGHPYTSIGKILIERGDIRQEDMSMDAIRKWMDDHPNLVDELLWNNQSYIFFKELVDDDPELGPVGAAKVQLIDKRSMAVDKSIYQYGLPIFIAAKDLDIFPFQKQFCQLMIAQDTGSAILGAARGDIFIGSGLKAGQIAGSISHKAQFYVLLPKLEI
ncbi:MAG: MltA domain-containing protein [Lentilitoribacter sp.]